MSDEHEVSIENISVKYAKDIKTAFKMLKTAFDKRKVLKYKNRFHIILRMKKTKVIYL